MTKSRLRILLVTGAGAVLLLASVATPSAQAKHSWGSWHWGRAANPASIPLLDSTSGDWKSIAVLVASDWTKSDVLDTPYTAQVANDVERLACTPQERTIRVCNASNPDVTWLGLATVYPSDLRFEHIAMATAQVNDFWFMGGPQDALVEEPAVGLNARRHVLCQEVGHTLGLDHQKAPSCMDDENGLNDSAYVSPNAHDYEQLEKIYAHLDDAGSGGGGNGKGKRQTKDNNGSGPEKRTDGYHGEGPHRRGHADWYIGEENGRPFVRYIIWAH